MKLDDRVRELIAIGASVTANCQPCLRYHAGKAREHGADEQEITVAIAVGKLVRRGAASKMDDFAAGLSQGAPSPVGAPADGCVCGS